VYWSRTNTQNIVSYKLECILCLQVLVAHTMVWIWICSIRDVTSPKAAIFRLPQCKIQWLVRLMSSLYFIDTKLAGQTTGFLVRNVLERATLCYNSLSTNLSTNCAPGWAIHFTKMCIDVGKDQLKELRIKWGQLEPFVESFQEALIKLPHILKNEKTHRSW
jgi:hypothetical protein